MYSLCYKGTCLALLLLTMKSRHKQTEMAVAAMASTPNTAWMLIIDTIMRFFQLSEYISIATLELINTLII